MNMVIIVDWDPVILIIQKLSNYLMHNILAIFALIFSATTLYRTNIKIDSDIETNAKWILGILLDDGESIVNDELGMVHFNIRIINLSNFDINYFDLRLIDQNNNEEIHYMKNIQFNVLNELTSRKPISFFDTKKNSYNIDLPKSNFGILKAHSITSVDIIFSPKVNTTSLFLTYKITKRKNIFNFNKIGYVNSPYQNFSQSILLDISQKPEYKTILDSLQN